jgi:hypothetical protein
MPPALELKDGAQSYFHLCCSQPQNGSWGKPLNVRKMEKEKEHWHLRTTEAGDYRFTKFPGLGILGVWKHEFIESVG